MITTVICPLEKQIFDWEDWGEVEIGVFNFNEVVLKIPVCQFPVGHRFSHAVFDMQKSIVSFYPSYDNEHRYSFTLTIAIGQPIPNDTCC